MNAQVSEEGAGQPRQFATTRWSLILSAANSQSEEQKARHTLASAKQANEDSLTRSTFFEFQNSFKNLPSEHFAISFLIRFQPF